MLCISFLAPLWIQYTTRSPLLIYRHLPTPYELLTPKLNVLRWRTTSKYSLSSQSLKSTPTSDAFSATNLPHSQHNSAMITLADEGFTDFEVANLRSSARSSRQDNLFLGASSVKEREGDPLPRIAQWSLVLIYCSNRVGICPPQVSSEI